MKNLFTVLFTLFFLLPEATAQKTTITGTVLTNPEMGECFSSLSCSNNNKLSDVYKWSPSNTAVNVVVRGTNIRSKTDRDGNFEITSPSPNDTLVFLSIGHNRKEVPIEKRNVVNVKLSPTPLPVIEQLVGLIMPKLHAGEWPDIDELSDKADVNRETVRDILWLIIGNRRMSEVYPGELIPDYRFED